MAISNLPTPRPKVYLSGPLGFADSSRDFYQKTIIPAVEQAGFEVIDPWSYGAHITQALKETDPAVRKAKLAEADLEVAQLDAVAIQKADCVLAILDGVDVDSGTASEIGYAAALGKPIEGYRGDLRRSGENEGCSVNLQVEGFIRMSGGDVQTTVAESLAHLKTLMESRRSQAQAN